MSNPWRQFKYQVQVRDAGRQLAEYAADGVPEYAQPEWRNRLKKSYPMKSASKELEYCITHFGRLRDVRLINTKTGNVIHLHEGDKA